MCIFFVCKVHNLFDLDFGKKPEWNLCTRVKKMVSPSFFCVVVCGEFDINDKSSAGAEQHHNLNALNGNPRCRFTLAPPHFFVLISGVRFPGINGTKLLAASAKMAPTLIWCVYAPIIQNII